MARPSSPFLTASYTSSTSFPQLHRPLKFLRTISCHRCQAGDEKERSRLPTPSTSRREIVLKSSEVAVIAAIFHFSGAQPGYLGVQKSPPFLALCPATNNCVSTSEDAGDLDHFVPPWNYNPEDGRGKTNPVSKEAAMEELLGVVKSIRPDGFTPRIAEMKEGYIRVEYESPVFGFVDDVEFWFPGGKKPLVYYRSASRLGITDFGVNKKRIKALRLNLEKKGWASESRF